MKAINFSSRFDAARILAEICSMDVFNVINNSLRRYLIIRTSNIYSLLKAEIYAKTN